MYVRNTLFGLLSSLAFVEAASAQDNQVKYRLTQDDPYMIRLRVDADTMLFMRRDDIGGLDPIMTIGANAKFDLTHRITLQGSYATALFKNFADINLSLLELGGVYQLVDRAGSGQVKLNLSQSSETNTFSGAETVTTEYIMAPATPRTSFGVRGGFFKLNDSFSIDDVGGTATLSASGVFAGLRFGQTYYVDAKIFMAGNEANSMVAKESKRYEAYADLLLAPAISVEGGNADTDPLGYRAGFRYSIGRFVTVSAGAEIGKLPGAGKGTHLLGVANVGLGSRVGGVPYQEESEPTGAPAITSGGGHPFNQPLKISDLNAIATDVVGTRCLNWSSKAMRYYSGEAGWVTLSPAYKPSVGDTGRLDIVATHCKTKKTIYIVKIDTTINNGNVWVPIDPTGITIVGSEPVSTPTSTPTSSQASAPTSTPID
jgi:hypothetical protein